MFAITEGKLKSIIAPIVPYYGGTGGEWLNLTEGELTTFSDIYRTQPAVRAVIDFMAGHLSRMPIKLFKQVGGGTGDSNEGDREHQRKHEMQKLLNVPNGIKRQGRSSFWNDAWKDLLIYDRMCLVKIRDLDSNNPVALVRVPPVWFTPFGENYFYPDGIRLIGNRGSAEFPIEDVIYIHGYDPVDPRIGVSPFTTLKDLLEEEAKSTGWRTRFWEHGLQQAQIISRPLEAPDWDDDARDRFIESLRAAANRGKPLLLEEGMTSNPSSGFDPKSAEYIQGKKFTREEVLRVYNLPVGLFEQANSPNMAQYRAMLYSETLAPPLGRVVDELETQLLTEWIDDPYAEGYYLEAAIEEKLRGNIMEQITMFTAATGGPIMTREEARNFMNLVTRPAEEKADKLLEPMNYNIAGEEPPAAPGLPGGPPGQPGEPSVPDKPANQNGPAKPATENDATTRTDTGPSQNQPPTDGSKPKSEITPEKLRAFAEFDGTLAEFEKRRTRLRTGSNSAVREKFTTETAGILRKYADRQKASVMSSKGANLGTKGATNTPRWNKELARDLADQRQKIATHYGTKAAGKFSADFDPDRMLAYNEAGAEQSAKLINDHTESLLEKAATLAAVAVVFEGLFGRMDQAADATTMHMEAFGQQEAVQQTGHSASKTWRATGDNIRPSHQAVDGEQVDAGETFSNGLRYPHDQAGGDPSEWINCKCELEFEVNDAPAD